MAPDVLVSLIQTYKQIPEKQRLEVLRICVCSELCIICTKKGLTEQQPIALKMEAHSLTNRVGNWLQDFVTSDNEKEGDTDGYAE